MSVFTLFPSLSLCFIFLLSPYFNFCKSVFYLSFSLLCDLYFFYTAFFTLSLSVFFQAWSEVCVPRSIISQMTQTTTKMLQSICCVSDKQTHNWTTNAHRHVKWHRHTFTLPAIGMHTHISTEHNTHTHLTVSITHGYRKDRRGWWADINARMSDSSKAFLERCVCVCVRVFKCPGAWGWESGGVQKAFFFHRWIERTTFTNGLFSARDSGFTSSFTHLHFDIKFCSYSPEPFGLQGMCSIHILYKDIYFCEEGCDSILSALLCSLDWTRELLPLQWLQNLFYLF